MALEKVLDNGEFERVIDNFRRKNKSYKNESRRDRLLILQSRYILEAGEGRLLKRIYYMIEEALLRNSYDFNFYVFNWDLHLHRETIYKTQ